MVGQVSTLYIICTYIHFVCMNFVLYMCDFILTPQTYIYSVGHLCILILLYIVEKPDVVVAVLVPVMLVVGLGVAIGLLIALVVWRWRKQKGKHNVEATEEAPGERRLSRRISKQLYKLTSKGRLSLSSTMSPSMEYLSMYNIL